MKKNIIIYIIAGVVVLAGLVAVGFVAFDGFGGSDKKNDAKEEETTSSSLLDIEGVTDYGPGGVPIIQEEPSTNEFGELIEYVTDAEGNTFVAVLETMTNGAPVTNAAGENVTANKPTTPAKPGTTSKPGTIVKPGTTTKPGTTPAPGGTTSKPGNDGLTGGNTVQKKPDGSQDIIKPDGTIALSYSYSEAGNYFYTDDDPWQRNFGFNRLYDIGAVFTVMYLDTFHVYYNHNGYDWMVQFWKGQYGLLFLGGEIGLYYKDPNKTTPHYNCAEEDMEINMQMTVYREGYGELFTRPYAPHWWTTAFVPGKLKKFSDRTELTMVAKLEFKTEEEREKFCNALEKIKDIDGNQFRYSSSISLTRPEYYTYNGRTVDLVWRYLDEDRKTPLKPVATSTTKPSSGETATKEPSTAKPTTPATTKPPVTQAPSFD